MTTIHRSIYPYTRNISCVLAKHFNCKCWWLILGRFHPLWHYGTMLRCDMGPSFTHVLTQTLGTRAASHLLGNDGLNAYWPACWEGYMELFHIGNGIFFHVFPLAHDGKYFIVSSNDDQYISWWLLSKFLLMIKLMMIIHCHDGHHHDICYDLKLCFSLKIIVTLLHIDATMSQTLHWFSST